MSVLKGVFTSESVSEGHPERICDQGSDAVVDAFPTVDPHSRVGCETFIADQRAIVAGGFHTARVDEIVRAALRQLGYGDATQVEAADHTLAGALHALRYAHSYMRAECLLRLLDLDRSSDTWALVGENWSTCDNIMMHRTAFDIYLRARREEHGFPVVEAMDAGERTALSTLPEVVTVYRGCYSENMRGLSWSTDREVAAKFPTLNRYHRPRHPPLLVTGNVKRRNIAFLKLDRKEAEVVAPWRAVHIVHVDMLGR